MLAFVPQILVANPKFDKKSETVGENFSLNVSAENIVMSGSHDYKDPGDLWVEIVKTQ